jgi:hypothetical protein
MKWPLKRKKEKAIDHSILVKCPQCASRDTTLKVNYGNDQPDYVKTWRGQRYLTFHCAVCSTDFSIAEAEANISIESQIGSEQIDDEEALIAAEEQLKHDLDENGDHRFR